MSWFIPAFDLWLPVTIAGFALTAAASLAVLLIREPARKIRIIQLALVGLLVLPALALLPGYPRVAWWPAVGEVAPLVMATKSSPPKSRAMSSTPEVQPLLELPRASSDAPRDSISSTAPSPVPPATRANPEPARTESLPADPLVAPTSDPLAASSTPPAPVTTEPQDTAIAPPSAQPVLRSPMPIAPTSVGRPLPDYRLLVFGAYLLGVALFALWWLVGRVAMWRLLRTAAPAEPHVRGLLAEIAATHTGQLTANNVRLLVSPRAAQPCAFGWLRPTIVLPERIVKELTPEQLRLALSHEWSHVARGDIRTWMLAGVVRLVHFHQPLVWLLRRELRISQDYLADAAAAGASTPEDYAELLTTLSRMLRPTPLSPGLGIAPRRSELYRRVVMLVDQSRPLERTIPRRWNLAAVMLGIALIAGVATLRAEPEEGQPAAADPPDATAASTPAGPSEPTTDHQRNPNLARLRLERAIEETQEELARLEKTRKQLTKQAEQQILVKERAKIDKQLEHVNFLYRSHGRHLDNCLQLLVESNLNSGSAPPTNPYEVPAGSPDRPEPSLKAEMKESAGPSAEGLPANETPAKPSAARPRTRQEPLHDPDRRDVALQLVTVGRRLETLLKTRKGLQLRLSNGDQSLEDRQQLEKALAGVDNNIADTSQRFVEMQAHFDAASLKEHDRAQAAAADWEPSGDKRRLLEASWAELDQLMKTRDQVFKQAAEQTNSKARAPYEVHLSQIDVKRLEIAHRIEELLQPKPTARAAGSRPTQLSGTPAARASEETVVALSTQEQREPKYHFLNRDPIRDSRKQLVERVLELQNQRRQLARTREPLEQLAGEQSRTDEGQKIKPELERLAAQEDQIAKEHDECLAKIQQLPLIPGDRLNLEIIRKGKDPQTLERTIPSDGNIVLASESGNIHYYVEGKTLAEVGTMIREQLKQLKSITADDELIIGYAGHDEQLPAEATSSAEATSAKNPEVLAKAILHNEPQYLEFQKELGKRQLLLSEQRSSGAPQEVLDKSQRSVLQLEEHIEEWKAARLPALLELVTAYSALEGQGRAATEQTSRAATERRGGTAKESQGHPASSSAPFSGRIRPGDILGIELVGGLPVELPPTRTVEPDGNVVLGAVYGPASRVNVAGLTLIEAGNTITAKLKEVLKDPKVVVTYEGHNDGVVAAGAAAATASTPGKPAPAADTVVLQPLDTIEVFLPLSNKQVWISDSAGTRKETFGLGRPEVSGMYLLEPDGRIALPQAGGRLKLAGLTEKEAGEALRKHLAVTLFPRSALPTARVMRRGHAVFPEGKQPPADYRIQPGDSLLMGFGQRMALNTPVDSDGNLLGEVRVPVAGMTLEEADAAIRKQLRPPVKEQPYNVITLGGWREEADPRVIDLIEGTDATQLMRMQEEMQELKSMIRRLQAE